MKAAWAIELSKTDILDHIRERFPNLTKKQEKEAYEKALDYLPEDLAFQLAYDCIDEGLDEYEAELKEAKG